MSSATPPASPPATLALLRRDLRERVFCTGARTPPRRIGAEVELLPVDAASGRMAPIEGAGASSLPVLRQCAARAGWSEQRTAGGAPWFRLPGGGSITYEPGGQIEFSSPPCDSVSELKRLLQATVCLIRHHGAEHGVALRPAGIDPEAPAGAVAMQLPDARYRRMDAYLARLGGAGAVMMRQTASLQVSLDWPEAPLLAWRVLNAAAPVVTAVFANSPLYAGAAPAASQRSRAWLALDPSRTGLLGRAADPIEEYLRFALDASVMLPQAEGAEPLRFGEWLARGEPSLEQWRTHLTTLFPEVRPKGFVEVRSADAVGPDWYAAPLVLLAGVAYHPPSLRDAAALLGEPAPELLERAARDGLRDPALRTLACDLWEIALRGASELGERWVDAPTLAAAREFFERYTRKGRMPGDDPAWSPAAAARRSA